MQDKTTPKFPHKKALREHNHMNHRDRFNHSLKEERQRFQGIILCIHESLSHHKPKNPSPSDRRQNTIQIDIERLAVEAVHIHR